MTIFQKIPDLFMWIQFADKLWERELRHKRLGATYLHQCMSTIRIRPGRVTRKVLKGTRIFSCFCLIIPLAFNIQVLGSKLMWLGVANQIVVVELNLKSELDNWFRSDSKSNDEIESTIAISIQIRSFSIYFWSIFDLFRLKYQFRDRKCQLKDPKCWL